MSHSDRFLELLKKSPITGKEAMASMGIKNMSTIYTLCNACRKKGYNIENHEGVYTLVGKKELKMHPPKALSELDILKKKSKLLPEAFQQEASTLYFEASYAIKKLESLISAVEESTRRI